MNIDEILQKYGLKYEDLNSAEKETLHSWLDVLEGGKLTIDDVRKYIPAMKEAVEKDLTKATLGSKEDLFLKARLRNYLLLEAFLSTPEKAKDALQRAIKGFQRKP